MNSPSLLRIAAIALAVSAPSLAEAGEIITQRDGFQNFHHLASTRKRAHVAFLGGSITQNGKGHTAMLPEWLRKQFPETDFTVTNAGLSSTCSVSGAFRVATDVLSRGPVDLLVVEFAVNDDQDAAHDRETAIRGMEGVIRQVRAHNPAADILMVHFINPHLLEKAQAGDASTSVAAHEAVAEKWNLTTVNLPLALAQATEEGSMDWERYGGVHPNQDGYRWATGFLEKALEQGWQARPDPAQVTAHETPASPLDPGSFGNVKSVSLSNVAMLGGWTLGKVGKDLLPVGAIRGDYLDLPVLRANEPGSMLYVEFLGQALTAFVLAGPDAGILEVSVDGGEWNPASLFHQHSAGLNYPRTVILAEDLSSGFHQVALRVSETQPEDSSGHAVSILKLGVVE